MCCASASAARSVPVSVACFSCIACSAAWWLLFCGEGVRDCGREREIDVGAVDSAERVVRGAPVDVDAVMSEWVIARDTLPLRHELATEPASESASRLGASARWSRSPRLRTLPKRDALLPVSRSRSSRPAAAKALAVRGPSHSVAARGPGDATRSPLPLPLPTLRLRLRLRGV